MSRGFDGFEIDDFLLGRAGSRHAKNYYRDEAGLRREIIGKFFHL